MTQGKKKKRAANRSIMLAKKIIIKDGGTVSWGTAPGSVPRGPHPSSAPSVAATSCPSVPALPHPVGGAGVSASWAFLFLLPGFPPLSRPTASGARPPGEAACLSRTCRPLLQRPLEA